MSFSSNFRIYHKPSSVGPVLIIENIDKVGNKRLFLNSQNNQTKTRYLKPANKQKPNVVIVLVTEAESHEVEVGRRLGKAQGLNFCSHQNTLLQNIY